MELTPQEQQQFRDLKAHYSKLGYHEDMAFLVALTEKAMTHADALAKVLERKEQTLLRLSESLNQTRTERNQARAKKAYG